MPDRMPLSCNLTNTCHAARMNKVLSICCLVLICLAWDIQAEQPTWPEERLVLNWQTEHAHSSSIVELSNGDFLACWFQGSGERTADDVRVMGAVAVVEMESSENIQQIYRNHNTFFHSPTSLSEPLQPDTHAGIIQGSSIQVYHLVHGNLPTVRCHGTA